MATRRRCRWVGAITSTSEVPGLVGWWRTPDGWLHHSGHVSLVRLRREAYTRWYEEDRPADCLAARLLMGASRRGDRPPVLTTGPNVVPHCSRTSWVSAGHVQPAPTVPPSQGDDDVAVYVDTCDVSFVDEGCDDVVVACGTTRSALGGRAHGVLSTRRLA